MLRGREQDVPHQELVRVPVGVGDVRREERLRQYRTSPPALHLRSSHCRRAPSPPPTPTPTPAQVDLHCDSVNAKALEACAPPRDATSNHGWQMPADSTLPRVHARRIRPHDARDGAGVPQGEMRLGCDAREGQRDRVCLQRAARLAAERPRGCAVMRWAHGESTGSGESSARNDCLVERCSCDSRMCAASIESGALGCAADRVLY